MTLKEKIKSNPQLAALVLKFMYARSGGRPSRLVAWFVNPFFHKRGKGARVSRNARIDVFPFNRFDVGDRSTVEDYTCLNNGGGDIIIGNKVRIGIGTVVNGPVRFGNGSGTGQHVFISGFNHGFSDGHKNSSDQPLDVRPIVIEDEAHIGSNSVVLAGVTIGKRCQIGAGSVVTKNIPPFSVAVGNPARVVKQFNHTTNQWEKVTNERKG
jgi:acetyltransferase-like isoleucine patch superfamily enzyme